MKIDTTDLHDNAPEIISNLKTRALSSKYYNRGKFASYTAERLQRELNYSFAKGHKDYAKSYIAWVDPDDFLYATTSSAEQREWLRSESTDLDLERLRKESQPIYLHVDFETGRIVGHEGRHRMIALKNAGVEKVAVILDARNDDRYNTKPIEWMKIHGQRFGEGQVGAGFSVMDVLPLSERYADAVKKLFSETEGSVQFSMKDSDYLAAVKRGDMETAQKMVDEAAKNAGYTEEVFHGMGDRYNVYKSGDGQYGAGVYFTYSKDIADGYGPVVDRLYVKVGQIADYDNAYKILGMKDNQTMDEFAQFLGFPGFDEMINDWDNDPTNIESNPELVELLKNEGFEGFVDDGNNGFVLWDFEGIEYRIKSAEPVTYDDNGNVIPLSKRFDSGNPDIRFSMKDSDGNKLSKAQVEYFRNSKVRDRDGNLLKLYHGTESFGFTVLDFSKSDDGTSFFMTDDPTMAESYSGTDKVRSVVSPDRSNHPDPYAIPLADAVDEYNRLIDGNVTLLDTAEKLHEWADKCLTRTRKEIRETTETIGRLKEATFDGKYAAYVSEALEALDPVRVVYEKAKAAITAEEMDAAHDAMLRIREHDLRRKVDNANVFYWNIRINLHFFQAAQDFHQAAKALRAAESGESLIAAKNNYVFSEQVLREDLENQYQYADEAEEGNYELYANLVNPLIVDAHGAYWNHLWNWSKAAHLKEQDVEVKRADDAFRLYRKATNKEIPAAAVYFNGHNEDRDPKSLLPLMLDKANYAIDIQTESRFKTRDIATWAKRNGYDGVVFRNIVDYGANGYGEEPATVVVAFDSNQVKAADNLNPTTDPDIRFSMKAPVEETKNLIALHNLSEDKLLKALNLGGFPMPSIAVTKTDIPHTNFGDITLVMNKSTIDPKASKKNTVYSADAWTPTFPQIEYEADRAVEGRISDKYYALQRKYGSELVRPLYGYANYLGDELNRYGGEEGIINRHLDDTGMMQVYLADSGKEPVQEIKKEIVTRLDKNATDKYDYLIDNLGEDVVRDLVVHGDETPAAARKRWMEEHGEALQVAYRGYLIENGLAQDVADQVMDAIKPGEMVRDVVSARNYLKTGAETTRTEIDSAATNEAIRKAAGKGYESWLRDLFSGVVADTGIYNNKDLFTPSGNRRSFKQTHYPVTLENIAKAMAEQNDGNTKNVSGFYGVKSLRAGTAKRFASIKEMHEYKGRLKHLTQEEADAITDALHARMNALITKILDTKKRGAYSNDFMAYDSIGNMLMEASELKTKSIDSISKLCKEWHYDLNNGIVAEIRDLLFDVAQMPVNIFEAKPERAVRFDEVLAAVIPDNSSDNLRAGLENAGVKVMEYAAGDNDTRLNLINSVDDAKFSLKGSSDLLKENAKLREVNAALREQFKTTKFAKVDKAALDKFTKQLLKDYYSGSDINEVRSSLDEVYSYIANGEDGQPPVWSEVQRRAYDVALEVLEGASALDDAMYQEYKPLREQMRTMGLTLDKRYEHDLIGYEDLNEFRKANFGRIKMVSNGVPVDVAYSELAQMYPEFFDESQYTNQAEQLSHIEEVLMAMQPQEVNPFDHDMREAATWMAQDIVERFFELPQAKPTFADKAERKLTMQKIHDAGKLQKVREQSQAKIRRIIEANREKVAEVRSKERQKRDDAVRKVKEHYREKDAKARESRAARDLRDKIIRHTGELSAKLIANTDKKHIPEQLKPAVVELLQSINLESNYTYDPATDSYKKNDLGLPTRRTKAFAALKELYQQMATELVIDPDLMGDDGFLSKVAALADKRIVDMNLAELETVWNAVRGIEATISSVNRSFAEAKWESISEAAEALYNDNSDKAGKVEYRGALGKLQHLTGLDMMTPEAYFHHLGESGDSLFRVMRNAQDKHIGIMKAVADFTERTLKGVNVRDLEGKNQTVTLGGMKVEMSTAQLMELYALMRRKQAQEHILIGGIVLDIPGKGLRVKSKPTPIRNIKLEELARATDKLTAKQREVVEALQTYASTELSRYGNEAAMQVYNYTKFHEDNYWPIRVNRQEVRSDIQRDTGVTTVANKGMTKATKPHANNSLRIGSIFDTFSNHATEMATYAAWLAPTEDLNRIRNYTFRDEDKITVATVKGLIDTVHGRQGSQYLENLLADIAHGVKSTHGETNYMSSLVANYKAASVGANLRVIIQQPTAILRALDMIDSKYMLAAGNPMAGWKKATKYAPIAQWKDWGYFDINTGRQLKDVLFDGETALDKVKRISMWGAGKADSISWGYLWNAVEAEVKAQRRSLKPGSEAFYKAVAARFTEIVDHTQVVDGILQRSQIMRSSDGIKKMATSFMGEPTKIYNMLLSAIHDVKYGPKDMQKVAKKRLARTVTALVISGMVNAMAQSVMDAVRDDDKDKDYLEKWLAAFFGITGEEETFGEYVKAFFGGNIGNTVNPAGYIPFVKDALSIIQGYDVSRMDMESIEKTLTASTNMIKALSGEGKYTIGSAFANLFAEAARLFGVPVANLKRDVKAFAMLSAVESDNYWLQYQMEKASLRLNYSSNKGTFLDILYRAYAEGDREAYDRISQDMIENGFSAKDIESGMKSRAKKAGVSTDNLDRFTLGVGVEPMFAETVDSEQEEEYNIGMLNGREYSWFVEDRGDILDEIISDFERRGFGSLDEATANDLLNAAYAYAEETALENVSGGEYDSDTKWINLAQESSSIGLTASEYIMLKEEYSASSLGAKGVYEAYDAGVPVETYLEFRRQVNDLPTGLGKQRKAAVQQILRNMGLTQSEYNYLYSTEYKSESGSSGFGSSSGSGFGR